MKKLLLLCIPFAIVIAILSTGGALKYQQQQSAFVDCEVTQGTLPTQVPKRLNGIFTEAANHYRIDPMVVALVYYVENYSGEGKFREPPPPYGKGLPWFTSIKFASGAFQFIPPTWRAYQFSNPEHQPGNVEDLTDAAYAAANYLSDMAGKGDHRHMPFGSTNRPYQRGTIANLLASYNAGPAGFFFNSETVDYLAKASREYNRLKSQPPAKSIDTGPDNLGACSSQSASASAKAVLAFAMKQLMKPYSFGAAGPDAYDCSGLTSAAFKAAGINLPRTAAAQWAATRKWQVSISNSKPGDLVFFKTVGTYAAPGHVGIVVDPAKGTMINALQPGSVVQIQKFIGGLVGITHPYPIEFGTKAANGYPSTANQPCQAGRSVGVFTTAKGNRIRICDVHGLKVNTSISKQTDQLWLAARQAGYTLTAYGFRKPADQIDRRRANCGTSHWAIWEKPVNSCSPPTAIPGESEHEQGLALDFQANGQSINSFSMPAWHWLDQFADRYGFQNLKSGTEPWHWSPNGR